MMKIQFLLLYLLFVCSTVFCQKSNPVSLELLREYEKDQWVDSVFSTLNAETKIAQLFWLIAYADGSEKKAADINFLVRKYQPGGLLYLRSDPHKLLKMTNQLNAKSRIPLMVSLDGEWGLGMRINGSISFPYQMTLGAIQDNSLIYMMGQEVAFQFKRMGLHVNFAPVVDVNNNPNNPVIGYRSFGEVPLNVAAKSVAYMQGMQDGGIMAVAKHFPGHGDTDTDSHKALPLLMHTAERIDSLELKPFRSMISSGAMGVMSAHLEIPSLEPQAGVPASISRKIVTDLLKERMGFRGLVITDAMNMQGVKKGGKPGRVDALALIAGNDIVEATEDIGSAIKEVKLAIAKGELSWDIINAKCRRALALKKMFGLDAPLPLSTKNLMTDINNPSARLLNRWLYESSVTVLRNKDRLPIKALDKGKSALVLWGKDNGFEQGVKRYLEMPVFRLASNTSAAELARVRKLLGKYDQLYFGIGDSRYLRKSLKNVNISNFFKDVLEKENTVAAFFGLAYHLDYCPFLKDASALITTYQDNAIARDVASQVIFGGVGAKGRLPVTVNDFFKAGDGEDTQGGIRFGYSQPEAVGMDSRDLQTQVDSIVQLGLDNDAFPGCQVLVAKEGKVLFNKAYGYHTYDRKNKVLTTDLYDLASITKIAGPLPLLMKMTENGQLDLDKPMSYYWKDWKGGLWHTSNKKDILLRDILAHQGGLLPYIEYWENTLKDGRLSPRWYRPKESRKYTRQVASNLYLKENYKRHIYRTIRKSELRAKDYKYSGLAFMVFPEMLSKLSDNSYPGLLDRDFFYPLGASTLGYLPLQRFCKDRIVPTETDTLFRGEMAWGHVHDGAAAMMGGISGNAGLFSNANDLAKVMQMFLNGGTYGGRQYLCKETIEAFSKVQFPENNNRRGLGFDKPVFGNDTLSLEKAYPAPGVSPGSYGHSGFTGTFVWIDPEIQLLYIFLSNRVHPTRENRGIYKYNIRLAIQQAFYSGLSISK